MVAGSVTAVKIYDRNANGAADPDEPGIPGWQFLLNGTASDGTVFGPVVLTAGADGVAVYTGLLPGSYTLSEVIPATGGWISS